MIRTFEELMGFVGRNALLISKLGILSSQIFSCLTVYNHFKLSELSDSRDLSIEYWANVGCMFIFSGAEIFCTEIREIIRDNE